MIDALAGTRIVVTGGAGLIGRPTLKLLATLGAEVTSFDRLLSGADGVRDAPGDIRDYQGVLDLLRGADAVVHLGGIPGPFIEDDVTTYAINACGTMNVFAAAVEARVEKVVYASSINANGLPIGKLRPPSRLPYDEDEPSTISDTYSLSKEANERAALMASARWGLDLTGLRFPLVCDIEGDRGEKFGAHIREAIRTDPIRQAYEGWSYLDAADAARAVAAALTHDTPAAPGILVAAPLTYLAEDTRAAAAAVVPDIELGDLFGREVGLDLRRADELLDFRADVLLEDMSIDLLATTLSVSQ